MKAAVLAAAFLIAAICRSAQATDCPSSVVPSELVKQQFTLSYVTLNKHDRVTGNAVDVAAFYFNQGPCGCSFVAPEGAIFSKAEVAAAAGNKKDLARLARKLGPQSGVCPSVMTNSPYIHCFDAQARVCQEMAQ